MELYVRDRRKYNTVSNYDDVTWSDDVTKSSSEPSIHLVRPRVNISYPGRQEAPSSGSTLSLETNYEDESTPELEGSTDNSDPGYRAFLQFLIAEYQQNKNIKPSIASVETLTNHVSDLSHVSESQPMGDDYGVGGCDVIVDRHVTFTEQCEGRRDTVPDGGMETMDPRWESLRLERGAAKRGPTQGRPRGGGSGNKGTGTRVSAPDRPTPWRLLFLMSAGETRDKVSAELLTPGGVRAGEVRPGGGGVRRAGGGVRPGGGEVRRRGTPAGGRVVSRKVDVHAPRAGERVACRPLVSQGRPGVGGGTRGGGGGQRHSNQPPYQSLSAKHNKSVLTSHATNSKFVSEEQRTFRCDLCFTALLGEDSALLFCQECLQICGLTETADTRRLTRTQDDTGIIEYPERNKATESEYLFQGLSRPTTKSVRPQTANPIKGKHGFGDVTPGGRSLHRTHSLKSFTSSQSDISASRRLLEQIATFKLSPNLTDQSVLDLDKELCCSNQYLSLDPDLSFSVTDTDRYSRPHTALEPALYRPKTPPETPLPAASSLPTPGEASRLVTPRPGPEMALAPGARGVGWRVGMGVRERAVEKLRADSRGRRMQRLTADQRERRRQERVTDRTAPQRHLVSRRGADSAISGPEPESQKRLTPYKARRRFKRLVRLVRIILRVMRIIVTISRQMTVRTAVEMQWYALNTSVEARKLPFNPALFAKSRAYAMVPRWAKAILCKDRAARTDTDCRRLHALLRGLRSFDKFTERLQLAMCRAATYLYVDEQRVILRKGHIGQNFYFLYSGSVFVNVEDVNAHGERFVKTEVVLTKGDSFGELALLKDIERTATIACRESCELLVIDKHVFAQVCPRIFDLELEDKVQFVSNLPLFHSKYWTSEALHNLCFEAQIQDFKTNKVIVLDSRDEDWMYTCMEGQCRIIKCLALDEESAGPASGQSLLREEDLLTAEFLDSMTATSKPRKLMSASRYENPRTASRLSCPSQPEKMSNRRKQLLLSLGLEYASSQKQEKDLLSKNAEDARVEEHRQRARQGVVTLSMLMAAKQEAPGGAEYVYLDIGQLHPGEEFDLTDILQPSESTSRSCLILVSSGAKVLRIKKDTVRACMSPEAMDHAKHIAMKSPYPTNEVLIQSYRERARWEQYKHCVVGDTVTPLRATHHPVQYHDAFARGRSLHGDKRRHHRLISSLRREGEKEAIQVDPGLQEEPVLLDHEDFESRLLKELDERAAESRAIPAINPGRGHRRSSLYSLPGLGGLPGLAGPGPLQPETRSKNKSA